MVWLVHSTNSHGRYGLYIAQLVNGMNTQVTLITVHHRHPRRLTMFGHIMHMDDNADANRILLASPMANWRRQPGRRCIMRLSTVQQDLKQHQPTLPEAADLAQNHPLWRMMSTYGATQS